MRAASRSASGVRVLFASLYMGLHSDKVAQAALIEPAGLTGDIFEATFEQVTTIDLFDPGLSETFWQNELLQGIDHESLDYKALLLLANTTQVHYFCDHAAAPALPVWRPGAFVEYVRAKRLGRSGFGGRFNYDFTMGLSEVTAEVLLIGTECSALGEAYQRRYHLSLFPNARVVAIENTGHRVMVEQRKALLESLRNYLDAY